MVGGLAVLTGCLESLSDKGEGNWDDSVTTLLNSNYEDWKDPKRTYMVPREFYQTPKPDFGKQTEKTFFDLLKNFGKSRSEPMFVIHSHDFAEVISEWKKGSNKVTKKWLTGEHDFVVIHRQCGIIFFQVKAAVRTRGKYSQAEKQIEKDKKALRAFVDENLSGKFKGAMDSEMFNYPGFVVMPNCPCPSGSVVKPTTGVFREDCENVNAFSEWWETKVAGFRRDTPFDQTLFEYLVMRFVGMSHSLPYTLSETIGEDVKDLEMCTTDQLSVYLSSVPDQWITGPAGSGKTWLLMKKVLMLAENALIQGEKEKILVVCYNKPLSIMLAKVFENKLLNSLEYGDLQEVVEVKTFDALLCDITESRSGDSYEEKAKHVAQALEVVQKGSAFTQRYDHVFVDECQDLCGDKWPTLFERLHKNDDDDDDDDDDDCLFREPKHTWFLYDSNQFLALSEKQYKQHCRSIRKGAKLTKVFRSTGSIFDQSKKYFSAINSNVEPIRLGHHVRGLEIEWDNSLESRNVTEDAGARSILKSIEYLRRNAIDDKDISVLTQNGDIRDGISSELEKMGIKTQNAEDRYQSASQVNKVVVESIRRFKGLESKVVILYNPQFYQNKDWTVKKVKELLYTAVSRCFCYLIVITTKYGCNALQSKEGITEQKIIQGRGEASLQSLEGLEAEHKSQSNALFNHSFSKRGLETQYESGPPELQSPSRRCIEDDDSDSDDIKHSPPKLLRKEEADYLNKKKSKRKAKRQIKVPGYNLLEPGDPDIQDDIRKKVMQALYEPVEENLKYQLGSSVMDESSKGDVTSVVARIEYKIYDQRRGEIKPTKYTKDCRNLKIEIKKFNNDQTCHESVLEAIQESQATEDS